MKRSILLTLFSVSMLVGCSSTPTTTSTDGQPTPTADTGDTRLHRYLAWVEGDLQTEYAPDTGEATRQLAEWEGKAPDVDDADKYLEYLSVIDTSGRNAEFESKIKAFFAKYPKDKRGLFLLAVHYTRLRKKDMASYLFRDLEKDSAFPWKSLLLNNLGMIALEEKNRTAALDYFEKAVQSNPPLAAPLVNLGALYLQSRSYADAERVLRRAYEIDKDFEDAALGLGVALEGQKKYDEAHRVYASYADDHPNALSVVYNDAILLGNRLNKKDVAAQLMLRYIQRGGRESARAQEAIQNWR